MLCSFIILADFQQGFIRLLSKSNDSISVVCLNTTLFLKWGFLQLARRSYLQQSYACSTRSNRMHARDQTGDPRLLDILPVCVELQAWKLPEHEIQFQSLDPWNLPILSSKWLGVGLQTAGPRSTSGSLVNFALQTNHFTQVSPSLSMPIMQFHLQGTLWYEIIAAHSGLIWNRNSFWKAIQRLSLPNMKLSHPLNLMN